MLSVIAGGAISVEFAVQGGVNSYAVLDSGAANQIISLSKAKNAVIVVTKLDAEEIFAAMEEFAVLLIGSPNGKKCKIDDDFIIPLFLKFIFQFASLPEQFEQKIHKHFYHILSFQLLKALGKKLNYGKILIKNNVCFILTHRI